MNFDDAVYAMKNGDAVCREDWADKTRFLRYETPTTDVHRGVQDGYFYFVDHNGQHVKYTFEDEDMGADDWMLHDDRAEVPEGTEVEEGKTEQDYLAMPGVNPGTGEQYEAPPTQDSSEYTMHEAVSPVDGGTEQVKTDVSASQEEVDEAYQVDAETELENEPVDDVTAHNNPMPVQDGVGLEQGTHPDEPNQLESKVDPATNQMDETSDDYGPETDDHNEEEERPLLP